MAIGIIELAGVFLGNAVLGSLLVLAVFTFMERHVPAGAVAGILLGTAVIWVEATYGETFFEVGVPGMKNLVLTAALGAVVGVTATVLVFEPDI